MERNEATSMTEAERLAQALEREADEMHAVSDRQRAKLREAAAELRRLSADARRYEWLRSQTRGLRDARGRCEFDLPDPHPLGNIMQGSVAQHLDAAIDQAMKDAP